MRGVWAEFHQTPGRQIIHQFLNVLAGDQTRAGNGGNCLRTVAHQQLQHAAFGLCCRLLVAGYCGPSLPERMRVASENQKPVNFGVVGVASGHGF